jgi:hypothetical protein
MIKKIALDHGVSYRPEALSGDPEPTISAMKHVLVSMETDAT